MSAQYREFLERKVCVASTHGFEVDPERINPRLSAHARVVTEWNLRGGRRADFLSFGMHKTCIQLETVRLAAEHAHGPGLIVLPLGVRSEFVHDAMNILGWTSPPTFIRSAGEIRGDGFVHLTNYETVRDGKMDPSAFVATSLDEAAVLRSYGSKTYQEFIPLFESVPYRFVATATPDPNRYKELIHYAGFLGIMDTGQALTRFFQRDSTQANNLTLYPHKTAEFWAWVHSWSVWLQRPSDLGFSDEGYDLPELRTHFHEVAVDHSTATADPDGQGRLFRSAALGVRDASKEKRETLHERVEQSLELARAIPVDDQFVIWVDLNDEQAAVERGLDAAGISYTSLWGEQDLEDREEMVAQWKARATRAFVSKPVMYGAGVNLQQCHDMIFAGVGYKFYDVIQAVHRIQRYGQLHQCDVHFVYAESEREVVRSLEEKWARHDEQVATMAAIIREHGLGSMPLAEGLRRSIGIERVEARGRSWVLANNDCVAETQSMESDSVDLIVTSIPFANHYEYTPSYNDFGHTDSNDHFWAQMDYLTPELARVLKPGRIACVHVKDRIRFGAVTGLGFPTCDSFHEEAVFHFRRHGLYKMGMITIVTDVVRENNQTYRLGWSEQCKDGTKMGCGQSEYVLLLRKPPTDRSRGYADDPVAKSKDEYSRARWQVDAHGFWRSSGNRLLGAAELATLGPDKLAKLYTQFSLQGVYDHEQHVAIGEALDSRGALPATFMAIAPGSHDPDVWHDVVRMRTLNGEQARRAVELHVCPLQLDIVERLIRRYSNEGDLVFDPFSGLATVPYMAVKMRRRGRGAELNAGYHADGARYCHQAEIEISTPTLFDALDDGEAA
jgi:hypothetical protein